MATRKASEGIKFLRERSAGPKVKATITVDQIYAHYQHEGLEFRHPRGGRAKYLELPMYEGIEGWLFEFAEGMLLVEEQDVPNRWGRVVGEPVIRAVAENAPVEFGALRRSAGLVVREGASVVMERPPEERRLSDLEIHDRETLRQQGLVAR